MQEHKNFWDKNAGRYDRFMRKDRAAYDEMYELIRPVVRHKTVLELATGTGLIAKHIVPQPEKALAEIRRVLKDGGVLIAPTFTHAGNSFSGMVRAFFMRMAGFPLRSKWTSEEYLRFLRQNGWTVRKSAVLKASFPLTYAECVKSEV
ncbi:class I SAM-dependent methyltransferase [Ruminococcus sp. CLA-AA-H200]|uniref:Class I SAM-dependent methyltransferase n=1 Tax=Ruminococcus turbiniformis TaxID=2881258 RepID=A0ABS8FT89_9FIRM|nr:class I SAM-dependent methyltransferase [Ruminococcus turbiniformis]MCC2253251.1 class I SAM-dependent methyltransferase [Ruminococcus turbiniformis]